MPLTEPAARELLHTRVIDMRGYIRDDGLWDIEGHLTDNKSYGYDGRLPRLGRAGDAGA